MTITDLKLKIEVTGQDQRSTAVGLTSILASGQFFYFSCYLFHWQFSFSLKVII